MSKTDKMSKIGKTFRVLVYREGRYWIAQCIDYDIAAYARNLHKLPEKFFETVARHIILAVEYQREPFAGLPRPPARFRSLFDAAERLPVSVPADKIPSTDYITPKIPPVDMRAQELRAA